MVKKALTIGINYNNLSYCTLNGCIDDIENITNVMVGYYGYARENIVQLRDDTNNPEFQPTRNNILSHLKDLVNDSENLTEILVHYSGHGSQIRDATGEEEDGMDEVIVPIDYKTGGFIIDKEIYQIIKNSKCKTVLIFDCCHSGTICDLQWSFEYNDENRGFSKTLNVNKYIYNPYVISLAGCKDSQTSADIYSNEMKQSAGAFTDALIHCLKANNYEVSILKLYGDICKYIATEGYQQKPILSCSSYNPNYKFETTTMEIEATKTPSVVIYPPPVYVPIPATIRPHVTVPPATPPRRNNMFNMGFTMSSMAVASRMARVIESPNVEPSFTQIVPFSLSAFKQKPAAGSKPQIVLF
jgi:hypothetical protein